MPAFSYQQQIFGCAAGCLAEGLTISDGLLAPSGKQGMYCSRLQRFPEKRAGRSITLIASTAWENGEPTERKVVPPTLTDAPIFLAKGPKDHWLFGGYQFPRDVSVKGDPHLFIDDDLTDGKPGQDMAGVFNDPADGSDCAVIRDPDPPCFWQPRAMG